MVIRHALVLLILSVTWASGCKTHHHISRSGVSFMPVGSASGHASDETVTQLIAPYKIQLDEKMSEVIGEVAEEMKRSKPEGELGNWICDAMMRGIRRHGFEADLAISNYGGIRMPQITAGPLTMGEVFELSPFENLVVIVDMPGHKLDTLFQHIAASEGWPVSEEMRMVIRHKMLESVSIRGRVMEKNTVYRVAMPDYVANGGDGSKIMTDLSRTQTGILVRDMIIEDAKATTMAGGKINAPVDGRIIIHH